MRTIAPTYYEGHPFLDSTDGVYRQASASHEHCWDGSHGPQSEYIHQHVHQDTGHDHNRAEAHLGSEQTALRHHDHHIC